MTEQTPRPIAAKIAQIMGELARVPKNGRNSFHNYDYVTESDLVDSLRPHLARHKISIFPTVERYETKEVQERNKSATLATVELAISFIDGESGDLFTVRWAGQGIDQGDKAFYKAYTGAYKYALMKTFMISTGEEPEQEPAPMPVDSSWQSANRQLRAIVTAACGEDKDLVIKVLNVIKQEERVASSKDLTPGQMSKYFEIVTPQWVKGLGIK